MKFLWNFIVQKRGYRSIEVSPILLAKVSKYRALHKADTFGTSTFDFLNKAESKKLHLITKFGLAYEIFTLIGVIIRVQTFARITTGQIWM